jgi:hypothetical protein
MKILAAKVRNSYQFDNLPTLEVLVDKIPNNDSLVYEQKSNSYFAEKDGYVSFFYYSSPGEGFGGHKFTINTKDGLKDLHGPWSSNSVAMENAGFPKTVNVCLTDDPKAFEKGYTFYSAHLTFEKFIEACEVANCLYGQNQSGFIHAMPRCEDCKFPYTQKYRTLVDEGNKYPKCLRKILCEKCAAKYNTGDHQFSSIVSYEITNEKRVINSMADDTQVQILG